MDFAIVFGVGLIALLKKETSIPKSKALFFIIAPIVLHFAWNSPLEGDWVTPLFGSINLCLAYYVFTLVDSLDEGDKIDKIVQV
ncbi:hypothetical protein SS771_00610 [Streptococcus agalactiae]